MRLSLFLRHTQRSVYFWEELYCISLCDSKELFGVCPMVFLFTLKGFSHKLGVLYLCFYFTCMNTIHVYDTIHPTSTNTTKE